MLSTRQVANHARQLNQQLRNLFPLGEHLQHSPGHPTIYSHADNLNSVGQPQVPAHSALDL